MASSPSRDGDMPRHGSPRAAALWGDGFAGDTLLDMWEVGDWALCSPDEYILLFPRLVPQGNEVSPVLRNHLEGCVAVRAWRLAHLGGRDIAHPLRSRLPQPDAGALRHRDWFADDDTVTCLLRRIGLLRTAPDRIEAERALLVVLDDILFEIQAGRVPSRDEASEALLAFGAGIHPAYVWPEAAVSPERGIAAGWLGYLDRGRTALMPPVVADYLLDVLGRDDVSCDRQIAVLAGGAASVEILLRAALRRSAGHDPSIRLSPRAVSLASFSGPSRRPLALGVET